MRIYLDNCCFNRPYDDQTQLRIELETKAKLHIQRLIVAGFCELVVSYVSEIENERNPYLARKSVIGDFFRFAVEDVDETDEIIHHAKQIKQTGIKAKDALHLAAAIHANCDYFLSTDDRVLHYTGSEIKVINPVDFIKLTEVQRQ